MQGSRGIASIVAAAALLVPAGHAGAAEVVGSNLAATPTGAPAPNTTRVQTAQPTGVTLPLTPTASGVIVSITLKHGSGGADPGAYGFRILNGPLPGVVTARTPAELADFVPPASAVPNTVTFTPTVGGVPGGAPKGIPIEAGERVGIARIGGTPGNGLGITGLAAGAQRTSTGSAHNSGDANYVATVNGEETTIQYLVEPDADRDGFGDETQDLCPTNGATQSSCPLAPFTPAPTAKKKCKKPKKKKGKKAGAAAKKKPKGCKKKKPKK